MSAGSSFAPRSIHQRSSDSKLPARAKEQAANSGSASFERRCEARRRCSIPNSPEHFRAAHAFAGFAYSACGAALVVSFARPVPAIRSGHFWTSTPLCSTTQNSSGLGDRNDVGGRINRTRATDCSRTWWRVEVYSELVDHYREEQLAAGALVDRATVRD
jgi:hypothetical protein